MNKTVSESDLQSQFPASVRPPFQAGSNQGVGFSHLTSSENPSSIGTSNPNATPAASQSLQEIVASRCSRLIADLGSYRTQSFGKAPTLAQQASDNELENIIRTAIEAALSSWRISPDDGAQITAAMWLESAEAVLQRALSICNGSNMTPTLASTNTDTAAALPDVLHSAAASFPSLFLDDGKALQYIVDRQTALHSRRGPWTNNTPKGHQTELFMNDIDQFTESHRNRCKQLREAMKQCHFGHDGSLPSREKSRRNSKKASIKESSTEKAFIKAVQDFCDFNILQVSAISKEIQKMWKKMLNPAEQLKFCMQTWIPLEVPKI